MRYLLALALAASCSDESGSQSDCPSAVERLERTMQGDVSGRALLPWVSPDIEVPIHASGRVEVGSEPVITIARNELWLDGNEVDAESLATNMETMQRSYGILHPGEEWSGVFVVLADARVDFARVDEVLRPFIARGYSFVLAAQTPREPAPPCPASWATCPDFTSGDASDRAAKLAEAGTAALGTHCTEVHQLFASIASVAADRKAEELRDGLPDALRSCGCGGVNMEKLEWLLPHMLGLHSPRAVGFRYEPGRSGTVGAWISSQ